MDCQTIAIFAICKNVASKHQNTGKHNIYTRQTNIEHIVALDTHTSVRNQTEAITHTINTTYVAWSITHRFDI